MEEKRSTEEVHHKQRRTLGPWQTYDETFCENS